VLVAAAGHEFDAEVLGFVFVSVAVESHEKLPGGIEVVGCPGLSRVRQV
jgi:hypothetical protein